MRSHNKFFLHDLMHGLYRKKEDQAIFVLFTPRYIQVKDPSKVKQHFVKYIKAGNTNFLFSNWNRPKIVLKQSLFGQIVVIVNNQSETKLRKRSDTNKLDDPTTNIVFNLVATKAEKNSNNIRTKK